MKRMRFKARMIWNIIRNRPVIANNHFKGGITITGATKGVIYNNRFQGNAATTVHGISNTANIVWKDNRFQ